MEDEEIRIIGTIPAISTSFSPIRRNVVILQKNRFSERKIVHNCEYLGQQNLSYYQPQPYTYS